MTELDCVMQDLHRARQYSVSLAYAAIASCCKPFYVTKDFPTGLQYNAEELAALMNPAGGSGPLGTGTGTAAGTGADGVATQQRIGARTNVLSPANTELMNYGERLNQLDPKFPIEAASEYHKDCMRAAANGVGLAYQHVSGDFQNLGFSASRMSELPARDYFKVRQNHLIDGFVRPHFAVWLKAAIMSGALDLPMARLEEFVDAAHFQGRRWAYVNPLQDEQAAIMALDAGFTSPQQIQGEREDGKPLHELYSEIEEAQALQECHGLSFAGIQKTQPNVALPDADGLKPEPEDTGQPPEKQGGKVTLKGRNGHVSVEKGLRVDG